MNNEIEIESCFKTSNPTKSHIFKWTIENYSLIEKSRKLRSPDFQPFDDSRWYATLEKKREYISNSDFLSLCFNSSSLNLVRLGIRVKLYNIDNDLKLDISLKDLSKPCSKDQIAEFHLYRGHGITGYYTDYSTKFGTDFPKNILVLVCEMHFSGYKTFTEGYRCVPRPSLTSGLKFLSDDLKKIYEFSLATDITVKVQGCDILAHRTILLARSNVFAKMLQSDMKENVTGILEIKDIEPQVFQLLLEYMYTGVCPETDFNTSQALYHAADKYCVLEFKQATTSSLLFGMTVENAVQLLSLAHLHSDKDFLGNVIAFVKMHLSEISILKAIREIFADELSNPELVEVVKILFPNNMVEKK